MLSNVIDVGNFIHLTLLILILIQIGGDTTSIKIVTILVITTGSV